ncbi:hypothetical protein C7S14_6741 [Burkholderia cepacia]|nr:hypothetical protein C7S14_6741 [Burkholderia cepacia]
MMTPADSICETSCRCRSCRLRRFTGKIHASRAVARLSCCVPAAPCEEATVDDARVKKTWRKTVHSRVRHGGQPYKCKSR